MQSILCHQGGAAEFREPDLTKGGRQCLILGQKVQIQGEMRTRGIEAQEAHLEV